MIDLEQQIKTKWTTRNKERYINFGYPFTKMWDELIIKAKHLPDNSNERVIVHCDDCGVELETPLRNYNGIIQKAGVYRCRKCNAPYVSNIRINNNRDIKVERFKELAEAMGYKSLASPGDYDGYNIPMAIECPKHGLQYLSLEQLEQGTMCPECGKTIKGKYRLLPKQIIKHRLETNRNIEIFNPEDYVNTNTKNLKVKCCICGNVRVASYSSIYNSNGLCFDCAVKINGKKLRFSKEDIISKCSDKYGKCYLLNPEDYIDCTTNNLIFECTTCGKTFKRSLKHYLCDDTRCSVCTKRMSKGELKIKEYLDNSEIEYVNEKRFSDCCDKKPLPFDFYLPTYNLCIEFDGIQHYQKNKFDTDETFKTRLVHDKMKDKYCKDNDIGLLRIPYYEYNNIDTLLNNHIKIT